MITMVRQEERRVQKRSVKSSKVRVRADPEPEEVEEVTEADIVSEDEEAYEEEEEQAEEEEAAEEEEEERPRRRAKKPAGKGNMLKIVAVIVVVLIVVGVVAYMFILPKPPTAKFTVNPDPNGIEAGTVVSFDASGSSGANSITKYEWQFGDDTTAEGKTTTHTYSHKGEFTVNLTVTDSKGLTAKASQQVIVTGMLVTVPKAMIGDSIDYDLAGYVDISNPDGFWTYSSTTKIGPVTVAVTAKVTQAHIAIDNSKAAKMDVTSELGTKEDGFAQMHSCVNGKTSQSMSFIGWATVKLYPVSGGTPQTLNQSVSGSGNANEQACSDLDTNTTVQTVRNDQYTVRLGSSSGTAPYSKSGSDSVTAYPKKRQEFNVNSLRDNRTFRKGDSGEHTYGTTTVQWEAVAEETVGTIPTLRIHLTMDDTTMAKNGFTSFDLDTWISSSFSAPLKTHLVTEGKQNGNTVTVDMMATYTSFTPGTVAIPFGTCTANTPDGHFYKHRPSVEYLAPDDYSPAMGTSDPSLGNYPLPTAVTFAKDHSSGLQGYLGSHSNAFLVDAYYNDTTGSPTWNLTFGVKDSTAAYNIIVTTSTVKSQANVEISEVGKSIKDFSTALSFAGAETVFKSYSAIKSKIYSGDQIQTQTYNFGSKAGVPMPEPAIPINTNVLSVATEYFIYVQHKDNSYSVGVDAETGQLLFVQS